MPGSRRCLDPALRPAGTDAGFSCCFPISQRGEPESVTEQRRRHEERGSCSGGGSSGHGYQSRFHIGAVDVKTLTSTVKF